MPNVERQEFEKRLETDSEFKIQVEDIKLFILSIESQSFKEQLNEYHKDIPEKTHNNKSSKIMSLRFLKYAAAVIILIAIGSFWFFGTSSHEKLYTQYFIPDPGLPTTMGKTE